MSDFFNSYSQEIINTLIVFGSLFVIQLIAKLLVRRLGRSKHKHKARIKLVGRYVTVTFLLLALLVEAFVVGVDVKDIIVLFSSIFAILGITLFANWSILSNVTSGIVMFFSFPYRIGVQIHIRKGNGELMTYPNSMLLQKAVTLVEKDAFDK